MKKYYLVSFENSENVPTTDYNKAVAEFKEAVEEQRKEFVAIGKEFSLNEVRRSAMPYISLEELEIDDNADDDDITNGFCELCGLGEIESVTFEEIIAEIYD